MAVHAPHLSHAFSHRVMETPRFLEEFGDTTLLGDFPRSELTCNYGFEPRKRALVAGSAVGFLQDQRVVVPPAAMQGRAVNSGTASTSGRMPDRANVSADLLSSRLHQQGAEIDMLVRLESERMCAGLQDARRRHARALLAAAERAATDRLRAAEAELERALRRNAELEDKARQTVAECQAWMGVARSHEAVAAGLRATLDQLLQPPCAATAAAVVVGEGEAEDAQSGCFESPTADANEENAASRSRAAASSCKACGGGEACVLLLPCRHLCLCSACEAAVDACPVCTAAKNASLHVLLS